MKFCENCGHQLEEGELFCPNCGAKQIPLENEALDKNQESTEQGLSNDNEKIDNDQNGTEQELSDDKEKIKNELHTDKENNQSTLTPGQKKGLGIGAILLLILAIIYFGLDNYYSPANQFERMSEVVAEADPGKLASHTTSTDPNFDVNEESLTPFTDYIKEHPEIHSDLIYNLNSGYGSSILTIGPDGKHFGLFDKYSLFIEPVYFNVQSNAENVAITMNEEEVGNLENSESILELGPYAPGNYEFQASGEIEGQQLTASQTVEVIDYMEGGTTVDLSLSGMSFNVYSNVDQAEVHLNGEKIGDLEEGQASFGPIQYEEGMELQLIVPLEEGHLETETLTIEDDYSDYVQEYVLEFENIVSISEIESFMNSFYDQISSITSSGSEREQSELRLFMAENEAMDEMHTFYVDYAMGIYNNENYDRVNFDVIVNEVTPTAQNEFQINYDVTYDNNYDYSADLEDREQIFNYDAQIVIGEPQRNRRADNELFVAAFANEELIYDSNN